MNQIPHNNDKNLHLLRSFGRVEKRTTVLKALCLYQNLGGFMFRLAFCVSVVFLFGCADSEKDTSDRERAQIDLGIISNQLMLYKLDKFSYPEEIRDLLPTIDNRKNIYVYLDKIPIDPWGTLYSYSKTSEGFKIWSSGKDRISGNSDDIINQY